MTNENDRCALVTNVKRCDLDRKTHETVKWHPFTPAPQASQPVCEHNHTMRHAYSHIPQGYDECSLCGATRVEGEDWRSATAQPPTASMEALLERAARFGADRASDSSSWWGGGGQQEFERELKRFIPEWIAALQATPAATEGERCDKWIPAMIDTVREFCERGEIYLNDCANHPGGKFQPTETEVTG